ncbi:class I SAM-dependent methyltransferase [Mycobacterium parmense]|uniref:class I SAM-dependent methyltransferase n=1 Tax=Mycobacterium parmense TaxID=185642 RepID=UPI000A14DB9D|nr:class I SAM-dependent methyltransferase [Mycobacterium parmense]MCV7352033.1 methyltransferase domain-containing protein [Mycobacterium parmense]
MVTGVHKKELEFTSHNIRLDDGTFTKPESKHSIVDHPWFISARGILQTVFPGDKTQLRLADVGCLEGGYAVEFARMGFRVLGIDVRELNIAACNYVKSKTDLPHLDFVQDNAFNIANYGNFDAVFCCGLLYHLDRPKQFLETISAATNKLLILQTHFSLIDSNRRFVRQKLAKMKDRMPITARLVLPGMQWVLDRLLGKPRPESFYLSLPRDVWLSSPSENEGLPGRWFTEFHSERSFGKRETSKWSSWDNRRSFWVQREYLLQTIRDVGFDLVLEQYDHLEPNIAECLLEGSYQANLRGTFIGIKTQNATVAAESPSIPS